MLVFRHTWCLKSQYTLPKISVTFIFYRNETKLKNDKLQIKVGEFSVETRRRRRLILVQIVVNRISLTNFYMSTSFIDAVRLPPEAFLCHVGDHALVDG